MSDIYIVACDQLGIDLIMHVVYSREVLFPYLPTVISSLIRVFRSLEVRINNKVRSINKSQGRSQDFRKEGGCKVIAEILDRKPCPPIIKCLFT